MDVATKLVLNVLLLTALAAVGLYWWNSTSATGEPVGAQVPATSLDAELPANRSVSPSVELYAEPTSGDSPLLVRFGGDAVSVGQDFFIALDFGDRSFDAQNPDVWDSCESIKGSCELSARHTYVRPGIYTATIYVGDRASISTRDRNAVATSTTISVAEVFGAEGEEKDVAILTPRSGSDVGYYPTFNVAWRAAGHLQDKDVSISFLSDDRVAICDITKCSESDKDGYTLVATVKASRGFYALEANPGCLTDATFWLRVEIDGIIDTVGPLIVHGGACGPG